MLNCSPKAFAMCPTRELCGNIQEATFTENSECARFNQSVIDKPITNADRIRAMSDAELVDLIFESPAIPCDMKMRAMMEKNNCNDCASCIMEWLQQPVGDGADE